MRSRWFQRTSEQMAAGDEVTRSELSKEFGIYSKDNGEALEMF